MAPLKPFWAQPSHPDVQEVIHSENGGEYRSKSLSRVEVPPGGLFAKFTNPPCNLTDTPTYATVQVGAEHHMNLNSDLVYINHSCEPSVIFDTTRFSIYAGPLGLKPAQEVTFFYPSTEWSMAQNFDCECGTPSCKGRIEGAKSMGRKGLKGMWLNAHIKELFARAELKGKGVKEESDVELKNGHERDSSGETDAADWKGTGAAGLRNGENANGNGNGKDGSDVEIKDGHSKDSLGETEDADWKAVAPAGLRGGEKISAPAAALLGKETAATNGNGVASLNVKNLEAAAILAALKLNGSSGEDQKLNTNGSANGKGKTSNREDEKDGEAEAEPRRGITSREKNDEMGGDTVSKSANCPGGVSY